MGVGTALALRLIHAYFIQKCFLNTENNTSETQKFLNFRTEKALTSSVFAVKNWLR